MKILITELSTSEKIREINPVGLKAIEDKISSSGYLDSFPITIDNNNIVIDGHHRVQACINLNYTEIPCIQKEFTDIERKKYAFQANEASETCVPMTFVDYAEFIWSEDGTQQETADILGWSVDKVKKYSGLSKVTQIAWDAIVTQINGVTEEVTIGTFSEGLMRPIVNLTPEQQINLIEGLISQKYSKQAFKKQAETYQQANKDIEFAIEQLKNIVTDEIFNSVISEIETGKYNLNLLIQNALDKHNKETSIRIINGDCIEEFKKLEDESIDLIATDPPYNMDKADWDSYGSGEEFARWCEKWLVECKRVLKPEGSIYIFGINRMLSHLQKYLDNHMVYRNWIVWDTVKGAGGGLWTNRHEAILYYSKTSSTYEDSEAVKLERHEENIREYKGKVWQFKSPSNVWRIPCVDGNSEDRTEHITQKPVEIMNRIIKANCPVGGLVCDPFSGSGTTAVSSYRNDRKFIGFELDKINYSESLKRINNELSD